MGMKKGSKHGVEGFVLHDNGYRGIPYHHINPNFLDSSEALKSWIDYELATLYRHGLPRKNWGHVGHGFHHKFICP